jgi:drug/metabolite transporter (DMT)-like permease
MTKIMLMYFSAFFCVLGIVAGQILFKFSARAATESGTFFSVTPLLALFVALSLYGLSSLVWAWALQKTELGRLYPIMALAFIFVPLGSHFVFGEKFSFQYFVGMALISLGILITVRA